MRTAKPVTDMNFTSMCALASVRALWPKGRVSWKWFRLTIVLSDYNLKMLSMEKLKKEVCDDAIKLTFLLILSWILLLLLLFVSWLCMMRKTRLYCLIFESLRGFFLLSCDFSFLMESRIDRHRSGWLTQPDMTQQLKNFKNSN